MVELSRSLHTKEPREARRRCLTATIWFRDTIEKLVNMPSAGRADLEQAAIRFFDAMADEINQPRNFDADHFDEDLAFSLECSRERAAALNDQLIANHFDGAVAVRAEEWVAEAGIAEPTDRERLYALQLAARAEREHMRLLIHALSTPATKFDPEDELFSNEAMRKGFSIQPTSITASTKRYPTLAMVIDDFKARQRKNGLGLSQIDEVGRVFAWFQEEIDPATPMDQISSDELRNFRNNIARMDRTRQGRASPFRQRLTDIEDRHIATTTAQKYWTSIQSLFSYACSEGMAPVDPAAPLLNIDRRKGEEERSPDPYTRAELEKLFSTPLYTGYKSPIHRTDEGDCHERGQHWWSGVLPLFTGMRAGEFSQLLRSDFVFDDPIPHLLIQRVDGDGLRTKSTKNQSSIRAVPLAPILLDLGLRQFVERRHKIQPKTRIFGDFRLGVRGKTSEGMTRFWGDYLRKFGLHKPGRSTHVVRHTVVERLRALGAADEDISAIVGHSKKSQTQKYGNSDYPLSRKFVFIEHLNYDLDLLTLLGGKYQDAIHKA